MSADKGCGGDQEPGAATPDVIAARTPVEANALPLPGEPHDSTPEQSITSDVLWPLVTVLGRVALRISRRTATERAESM